MGAFVSYFFSGFILGKIPFPLSPSFRLMLQVPPRVAPAMLTVHSCWLMHAVSSVKVCVLLQSKVLPGSSRADLPFFFHLSDVCQAMIGKVGLEPCSVRPGRAARHGLAGAGHDVLHQTHVQGCDPRV